jgi:hypothetical protein
MASPSAPVQEARYVNIRLHLSDEYNAIKQIASQEFEGNVSMAVRRAIREFVEDRRHDDDTREASTCVN